MTCFVASGHTKAFFLKSHTQAYSDISEKYDGENVSLKKNGLVLESKSCFSNGEEEGGI
jgi:hypothetical protein